MVPACAGGRALCVMERSAPAKLATGTTHLAVCAHHAGAGKTNIAMLSVLREVGANMRHGVIQRADFKVCVRVRVYVHVCVHAHMYHSHWFMKLLFTRLGCKGQPAVHVCRWCMLRP